MKSLSFDLILDGGGNDVVFDGLFARVQPPAGGAPPAVELRDIELVACLLQTLGTLTLRGVRLTGDSAAVAVGGGGVLTVEDSFIQDNHLGAVLMGVTGGTLNVVRTEISGNSSGGPLVVGTAAGEVVIIESTISDNMVEGTTTVSAISGRIESSTISGNTAGHCGGVHLWTGTIENTTISGNHSRGESEYGNAGGLCGCPVVRNSTVVGNTSPNGHSYTDLARRPTGGPVFVIGGCGDPLAFVPPALFSNTIVSGSCGIWGVVESHGGNVESPGRSCGFLEPSDQQWVEAADLRLAPLTDNAGPTETHALLPGSVAVDAGVLESCPLTDQRGFERPEPGGIACDAGAYEFVPEPGAALTGLAAVISIAVLTRRSRVKSR